MSNAGMSRWNIIFVGSPRIRTHIGHVDFMPFVPISFTLGGQRERNFKWNIDFRESTGCFNIPKILVFSGPKAALFDVGRGIMPFKNL